MHNISFVIFVYIPLFFPYYYLNYNKRTVERDKNRSGWWKICK